MKRIIYLSIFILITASCSGLLAQSRIVAHIDSLLQLADKLQHSDPDRAWNFAVMADSLSRNGNYQKGIINSLKQKGNLRMTHGYNDQALELYFTGLSLAEEGLFQLEQSRLLNNIGLVYQAKGEFSKALNYHLRSFEISNTLNDREGISKSSNNIGIIHYNTDNTHKALEYFNFSLRIKEELDDTPGIKQSLNNLAAVYVERFEYDSALIMYNRCLQLESEQANRSELGITLNNIGQLHLLKGEFRKAQDHLHRALEHAKAVSNRNVLSTIYDNLGMIQSYKKNYAEAVSFFDSSLAISRQCGDIINERTAYLHLSDVYYNQEDYKSALEYYREYENLTSRLFEESSRVTESEAVFIKQQKENEILRLERDREARKLQISILISVLVFIAFLGIVLYIVMKLKQRQLQERTLAGQQRLRFKAVLDAQEQERKRIAGELHDSIGQLLSVLKLTLSDMEDSLPFKKDEERKQYADALNMVDEACNEVRSISHNIMPSALIRSGIVPALRELVDRVNKSQALKMELDAGDFPNRLNENTEFGLYRIIQELVNNILKHAKADKAFIKLSRNEKNLSILVSDNGIGISKKDIENSTGIGWKNIYSRLGAIGANIDIERRKEGGSSMKITFPLID